MTEWRESVLGDLCTRVTVGHVGKMSTEYVPDGVPFLRSQNVRPFVIDKRGLLYIGDDFNAKLRKSALSAGDVVIVRTGYPGTAAVVPEDLDGSNCADLVVITPSDALNPHVLAALFNSVYGQHAVSSQLVGSAQQHFNVGSAKTMRVRLPDRAEQDHIARVLCSINDLIENNGRRVEVLEEMARAIYREWFVKFRYPGHKDVPLVDSSLGPIPKDWGIAPASAAITVNPRIKLDKAGGHPFIAMGDLDERTMGCRPSQVRSVGSGAKFAQGDTLFARITPCLENGKTGLVQSLADDEVGLGSTEFIVLRGRDVGSAFTYCLARDSDFRKNAIASMSGASGRQRVRNGCFDSYLLAVPPRGLADAFERSAEPLVSQVAVLTDETERLRQLRDLLLPKLVSGQIDVSSLDLDAKVGEQVA
jgi:type I restriction enzyme S subunit